MNWNFEVEIGWIWAKLAGFGLHVIRKWIGPTLALLKKLSFLTLHKSQPGE